MPLFRRAKETSASNREIVIDNFPDWLERNQLVFELNSTHGADFMAVANQFLSIKLKDSIKARFRDEDNIKLTAEELEEIVKKIFASNSEVFNKFLSLLNDQLRSWAFSSDLLVIKTYLNAGRLEKAEEKLTLALSKIRRALAQIVIMYRYVIEEAEMTAELGSNEQKIDYLRSRNLRGFVEILSGDLLNYIFNLWNLIDELKTTDNVSQKIAKVVDLLREAETVCPQLTQVRNNLGYKGMPGLIDF